MAEIPMTMCTTSRLRLGQGHFERFVTVSPHRLARLEMDSGNIQVRAADKARSRLVGNDSGTQR